MVIKFKLEQTQLRLSYSKKPDIYTDVQLELSLPRTRNNNILKKTINEKETVTRKINTAKSLK